MFRTKLERNQRQQQILVEYDTKVMKILPKKS